MSAKTFSANAVAPRKLLFARLRKIGDPHPVGSQNVLEASIQLLRDGEEELYISWLSKPQFYIRDGKRSSWHMPGTWEGGMRRTTGRGRQVWNP